MTTTYLVILLSFYAFLNSITVSGAPAAREDTKIINGIVATPGEYPYVVSITLNDEHICGGMIYSSQWVVTAASCVYQRAVNQLKVTAGRLSLNTQSDADQVIAVFRTFVFDSYNATTKLNDIALLQLARSLTFNDIVNFVPYDEVDTTVAKGDIIGWGASFLEGPTSLKLRKATVTVGKVDCLASYPASQFNSTGMICAGAVDDGVSPCAYDEGGPLIQKTALGHYAVGIFSKNRGCATAAVGYAPSVYTRLSSYYSWLQKTAGSQP